MVAPPTTKVPYRLVAPEIPKVVLPLIAELNVPVVPENVPPVKDVPITAPRVAVEEYRSVAVNDVAEALARVVLPTTVKSVDVAKVKNPFVLKRLVAVALASVAPPVTPMLVEVAEPNAAKVEKKLVEVALEITDDDARSPPVKLSVEVAERYNVVSPKEIPKSDEVADPRDSVEVGVVVPSPSLLLVLS